MPTPSKTLRFDLRDLPRFPSLTPELLRLAYQEMLLARCHVERVVQECAKGTIKFAIWGSGEELHGAAEALAFADVVNPEAFGICAHYRSAGLWPCGRGCAATPTSTSTTCASSCASRPTRGRAGG
ncbi:hypothetical protein [Nannocystis pusilla]|uniref:hypothetical protein n=1 Tax=Nannocystis pusilla TaxID=889268 RepID=UPI003B78369C